MNDTRLEKLGVYFTHFSVHHRFGITFEQFIKLVENGRWAEIVGFEEKKIPAIKERGIKLLL